MNQEIIQLKRAISSNQDDEIKKENEEINQMNERGDMIEQFERELSGRSETMEREAKGLKTIYRLLLKLNALRIKNMVVLRKLVMYHHHWREVT